MLLILIGLLGLWIGTRWIIKGALGIAHLFNLSHSFVGIAILAVGTDLPEVFVSIDASILHLKGVESSGIITGNAIGSALIQITFVLGLAGLFLDFKITKSDLQRDGIALIASIVLLLLFGYDEKITRIEGATMLIVYIIYYMVLMKNKTNQSDNNTFEKKYSTLALFLFFIFGFMTLILSSHLVVANAMLLAEKWGVAQSFIGIIIIGVGTSLPELAVSVGAALNKSSGMAVGNIIGSNIFDGLIPIALGGIISTTRIERSLLIFDLPVLLGGTLLVIVFLKSNRGISKREGTILIVVFLIYMITKIVLL